jgi:hypothetical protein
MLKQHDAIIAEREKIVAEAVAQVAAELRLIEATDLVAFIRAEQLANIRHLVNSSTELYFKPETLSFGDSAEARLSWDSRPIVVLDMEFRHRGVRVYFRLQLEDRVAGVEIDFIGFENESEDPSANTARLASALADARL